MTSDVVKLVSSFPFRISTVPITASREGVTRLIASSAGRFRNSSRILDRSAIRVLSDTVTPFSQSDRISSRRSKLPSNVSSLSTVSVRVTPAFSAYASR